MDSEQKSLWRDGMARADASEEYFADDDGDDEVICLEEDDEDVNAREY